MGSPLTPCWLCFGSCYKLVINFVEIEYDTYVKNSNVTDEVIDKN